MVGKREANRENLKERLIVAARDLIREKGINGLRARDVTAKAGCALGGLYTVFEDIDGLVFQVNALTLGMLDEALSSSTRGRNAAPERLRALARSYLRFALENRNLWGALFDHQWPDDKPVPEWYVTAYVAMFRHVVEPLQMLDPDLTPEQLSLKARTIFSAVHGIVAIAIEERFVGLPKDRVEAELDEFIGMLTAGIKARN